VISWYFSQDAGLIEKMAARVLIAMLVAAAAFAGPVFAQTQPTRPSAYATVPTIPSAFATAAFESLLSVTQIFWIF
jgi:hypothetical protein